ELAQASGVTGSLVCFNFMLCIAPNSLLTVYVTAPEKVMHALVNLAITRNADRHWRKEEANLGYGLSAMLSKEQWAKELGNLPSGVKVSVINDRVNRKSVGTQEDVD
ncbi:MAG: hypothetical protein WD397_15090, partial [Wenzhouxiangellaceae bacterium]